MTHLENQYSIKHRPLKLEDLVGQDRTVRQCRSLLETGIPSCILISGKTGTGKTTQARILANAINSNGLDIHEYNVSDKRKIEDVRDIINILQYKPLSNDKHIIILDEVHQMQKQAASALLKPLEEKSAIWILCTDQPATLMETIRNRCYSLPLEEISQASLLDLLKKVKNKELKAIIEETGVKIGNDEDKAILTDNISKALLIIAETSSNCPRQALQTLQSYIVSLRDVLSQYKINKELDPTFLSAELDKLASQQHTAQLLNIETLTAFCTKLVGYFILSNIPSLSTSDSLERVKKYLSYSLQITAENAFGIVRFSPKAIEVVLEVLVGNKKEPSGSDYLAKSILKFLLTNLNKVPSQEEELSILTSLALLHKTLLRLQIDISIPSFDVAEFVKARMLSLV